MHIYNICETFGASAVLVILARYFLDDTTEDSFTSEDFLAVVYDNGEVNYTAEDALYISVHLAVTSMANSSQA
jgi:hypothetical protein